MRRPPPKPQIAAAHALHARRENKDLDAVVAAQLPTGFMVSRMQELLRSDVAGRPGLPTATVTRVLRIENTVAWSNYQHKKATMLQLSRGARPAAERAPPHRVLCAEANEMYLFHGTSPEVASLVARWVLSARSSRHSDPALVLQCLLRCRWRWRTTTWRSSTAVSMRPLCVGLSGT